MPGVIVVCPVHGPRESSGVWIDNVMNANISNITLPCPECGRPAKGIEGVFNFRAGLVEIVTAPDWTREAIHQAQDALGWARREILFAAAPIQQVAAEVQGRFDKAAPGLGKVVADGMRSNTSAVAASWISALIALLTLIESMVSSGAQQNQIDRLQELNDSQQQQINELILETELRIRMEQMRPGGN